MPRRKSPLIDLLILMPWWVSGVLAINLYFFAPAVAATLNLPSVFIQSIGTLKSIFALLFLAVSLASLIRSFQTRASFEKQTDLESLKKLHWKEFEEIMAEVYRRQGYAVEEQLGGGADGGVDLTLSDGKAKTLVQCKRYTSKPVPVQTVRELNGIIAAEGANAGILATTTTFTPDAKRFAAGTTIELIDGSQLLALVKSVQRNPRKPSQQEAGDTEAKCPECGSEMVLRLAKKGANVGKQFWDCSSFPKCRKIIDL